MYANIKSYKEGHQTMYMCMYMHVYACICVRTLYSKVYSFILSLLFKHSQLLRLCCCGDRRMSVEH